MSEPTAEFIDSMCLTWRHDFGLVRENGIEAAYCGSGMTEAEREACAVIADAEQAKHAAQGGDFARGASAAAGHIAWLFRAGGRP